MDRNQKKAVAHKAFDASLSARRAWIEIEDDGILSTGAPVALRKESVYRNYPPVPPSFLSGAVALRKESVDRNIRIPLKLNLPLQVALRKESVDRNRNQRQFDKGPFRRSPQGERG